MKRRLLFLFAVFMIATSVGWGQDTPDPIYYRVTSAEGGDGTLASPLNKLTLDVALADANSRSDSVVILLPAGSYTSVASPFSITCPSLAIVGEADTSSVTVASPVDITLANGGAVSFERVHLSANTSAGRGVVDIKSSNTTVSFLNSKITIEGRGTADGGPTVCFGIVSQVTYDNNTINYIGSRMYMSEGYERGLAFRDGAGHTLNFVNSQMDGPSAQGKYPYVIGICAWPGGTSCKNPVTYNILNSTIDINYYAVFTNNQSGADVPVNITIDNSDITAWSALYLRGDNAGVTFPHKVNITNTRMRGRSYQNGPSDGFGTIVFEVCPQLDLTMDTRCSIVSENMAPIPNPPTYMCVADIRQTHGTWKFVPSGSDKGVIQSNNDAYAPVLFFDTSNSSLNITGAQNVSFRAENGRPCIVSFNADHSLKNASSDLTTLLANTTLEDGDNIIFPKGEFSLPAVLSIDKSVTIQGAGQNNTIIKGAIRINGPINANTATEVKIEGMGIDYTPAKVTSGKCVPIIEVAGNVDLLVDGCAMNNNTQGYGDRKHSKPAEAWQNAILLGETAKGNVCIQNTTIYLKGNSQSGVLVDGELTDVSLVNSRIEGDAKGSNQFGLCIHHEKTPITLDNSTILLNNHYCIYANNAGNQKLTIKNKSNVVGYGALYLYETSNMNVHVSGESLLTGKTKNNGTSDSFATVVISTNNSTAEASNNTIVIEDSYIGNKYDMQETRGMTPIKINGGFTPIPFGNRFILKGKTILSTSDNVKSPILVSYGVDPDEYDNVVVVEGNDVQFQDQYGKSCVIITKPDGSFVNAVVSIISAIDFGELYGTTYYHEEVAHAGEMIMLPDTTIAETIRSLNAAEYNFFNKPPTATSWDPYTIPDGVVFNCKDGCLVTNESDAKAFAIGNPYKRVYWLQQGEESFTMKECVVAIDIAKDTTWATSFADRQVNVLNGATLTISSAMALDTVTIEEGAQVISTATGDKVTAKSLRFAPVLSGDKWKDLGMPFASGVIKNSKGETVVTPSLKDANEGIWFANLKDSKTPEFTVDETAFGMAGLWAANGDSYTISSKETFEFKTLEEPVAPTETGTFLMCSNPNTFAITLKQSAYILTADGQSFEQEANPEIKPFQSFVLTDTKTLSTLRSLRIGEGVITGNQTVEPVDGYYVSTERGAIVIHTAEAVDVMIIGMNGKVAYRGEATDGQRIELPSGIYAVNGQLVRVK